MHKALEHTLVDNYLVLGGGAFVIDIDRHRASLAMVAMGQIDQGHQRAGAFLA